MGKKVIVSNFTVHIGKAGGKQHYTAISHTFHNGQAGYTQLFCIQYGQAGDTHLFNIQCTMGKQVVTTYFAFIALWASNWYTAF